jgi:hypothetical protein
VYISVISVISGLVVSFGATAPGPRAWLALAEAFLPGASPVDSPQVNGSKVQIDLPRLSVATVILQTG